MPTEELSLPHGILTMSYYRGGLDHSLIDSIGVCSFRTIEMRLGWVPSKLRGLVFALRRK